MIRKFWAVLKGPYPADSSSLSFVFYGLGSGLFVFQFFAVFEPFGFSLLPEAPRRALFIGYGLVTCLAIVVNGLLAPRLRPRFFREENWSLGRQILWMGWVTLTIGLGCYLLSGAICARYGLPSDWVRLRTIVLDTFIIAVFPITVINLANYARLLHRNARVVREANLRLENPAARPQPEERKTPPAVELVAENGRDTLRVALDDLLFIQAEENYVQVHYRGDKPGRVLLRSSLTRIERQLRPFLPRLFRCHRAYIVNTSRIARVEGNAQGLKLTLKDAVGAIPVARRYVGEFRRMIRGLYPPVPLPCRSSHDPAVLPACLLLVTKFCRSAQDPFTAKLAVLWWQRRLAGLLSGPDAPVHKGPGEFQLPKEESMKSSLAGKHTLPITAWVVMLIVSDLPDMLVTWLGAPVPSWIFWAKAAFLAIFLGLTRISKAIRPLWQYALALLTLFIALGLTSLLRGTAWFQGHFNFRGVPFFKGFAAVMILDILVALAVIAVLWLMKRERRAFFLVRGSMNTPIEPIRWLGIKAGESWKKFTWIFAGIASLAVAVPTFLAIAPSGASFLKALPLLPACVFLAAVNAFTEEAYFRCSLLSTLHEVIGRGHTLALILVFFGLSHWLYGSPNGLMGFAMTGFLSWIMARSMLETRGMLAAWIIHFFPDVVIFVSYALLFVRS